MHFTGLPPSGGIGQSDCAAVNLGALQRQSEVTRTQPGVVSLEEHRQLRQSSRKRLVLVELQHLPFRQVDDSNFWSLLLRMDRKRKLHYATANLDSMSICASKLPESSFRVVSILQSCVAMCRNSGQKLYNAFLSCQES